MDQPPPGRLNDTFITQLIPCFPLSSFAAELQSGLKESENWGRRLMDTLGGSTVSCLARNMISRDGV